MVHIYIAVMLLTNNVKVIYNSVHEKHVTGEYQNRVHLILTVLVEKVQVSPSIREKMKDRKEATEDEEKA